MVEHGGGLQLTVGHGSICRIMDTADQHLHKLVLVKELREAIGFCGMDAEQVIFQHVKNPERKAKSAQEWPSEQPFEALECSAQPPSLDTIERHLAPLERVSITMRLLQAVCSSCGIASS